MKLEKILKGVDIAEQTADTGMEIGELKYDSRQVQNGDVFVAITGYETDGHKYISKAIELGASAIVLEHVPEGGISVPYIRVDSSRRALAQMAANYFDHPADSMTMVGITGTNGKTTTTYLLKTILEAQGHTVGLIGTNQNMIEIGRASCRERV